MLLLADDPRRTLVAVVGERLGRVLQEPRLAGRLARRHRRGQIDQPAGVGGEPAHDLQGRRGVLLPDGDAAAQTGRDDPLAQHVLGVEQLVVRLLRREGRSLAILGEERPRRLAVGPRGRDRDELFLGVAQGRELAAEDAAGIDVDRPIEPVRLGDRRVAVDDHRRPAILGRPVEPDGQPELVGLAGGLAVEGEFADPARAASLHLLLHPGVRHDQPAVVEHVMAHQIVEEVGQILAERRHERLRAGRRVSARVSASPCVICTFLPRSFRTSFTSWLPGMHRAEPARTMFRTSRTVSRIRGPRSTRSPRKIALRPSGWT